MRWPGPDDGRDGAADGTPGAGLGKCLWPLSAGLPVLVVVRVCRGWCAAGAAGQQSPRPSRRADGVLPAGEALARLQCCCAVPLTFRLSIHPGIRHPSAAYRWLLRPSRQRRRRARGDAAAVARVADRRGQVRSLSLSMLSLSLSLTLAGSAGRAGSPRRKSSRATSTA